MNYQQIIRHPSQEARGMTRWWWYGCCVDKKEIDRELDEMQKAGIGGVELQILYPVEADDAARGLHNIPFGSPEFFDILDYTARACQKRGMVMDLTPGSSWPYGGPFVSDEEAQQEALPYQLDLHGPMEFSCDFTTRFAGTVCAAVLGKMRHSVMIPETVQDVTEYFTDRMLFGWPWGMEVKKLHIPEGDWKLCFFVISMHRNQVGKPGRNAQGKVIDHCNPKATEVFLTNMVEPIAQRVPGIRCYFCDSIEVEGHNWSGVLLEEFKRRRGYDLRSKVYALWGDMGRDTPQIRYDYFKTMGELTIENFFDPLTDFAHRHNALSRIQAHGTWGDILRVYAAADIPEGETFGDHRTLEVNTIHRRLAASAGHVYGRELISNETFTWLKRPRFTETLEEMKAAADAVFVDGINMIVNHGYAYSPEQAGKRGWPFYASTHINHTTPWWPYYGHLGRYIQRVSQWLRLGRPVRPVAVYLPQADVYSDNMLSELHLAMRIEEQLNRGAMDRLQKAGYWFDYINDEALCRLSRVENGGLLIGENLYRAILLVGCTRLPVESARRLAEFARAGGILLAAEQIPDKGCGLADYPKQCQAVRRAMKKAFSYPQTALAENREEALRAALRQRLAPDIVTSHPEKLGYTHRVQGADHLYFFSFLSETAETVTVTLPQTAPCRLFSTMDGEEMRPRRLERQEQGVTLEMDLQPHESFFLVFSPEYGADPLPAGPAPAWQEQILQNWQLTVPEKGLAFTMTEPESWERLPGLLHFSGVGEYACDFALDTLPEKARLAWEHTSCAATVLVNGQTAGEIWTRPYELDITPYLREGKNHLVIRVASTLVNEMREKGAYEPQKHDVVLQEWPYYGRVIDLQTSVRLHCRREQEEQTEPLPSGIWGSVMLKTTKD